MPRARPPVALPFTVGIAAGLRRWSTPVHRTSEVAAPWLPEMAFGRIGEEAGDGVRVSPISLPKTPLVYPRRVLSHLRGRGAMVARYGFRCSSRETQGWREITPCPLTERPQFSNPSRVSRWRKLRAAGLWLLRFERMELAGGVRASLIDRLFSLTLAECRCGNCALFCFFVGLSTDVFCFALNCQRVRQSRESGPRSALGRLPNYVCVLHFLGLFS